ncbi:MAG: helix-turn-helix domain-containing protein [Pseudomonadota bacterium]
MQTATVLAFRIDGSTARWSIEFLDRGADGRFQNELLGISYLIDGVRCFTARSWAPALIRSTCTGMSQAAALEAMFEAPVRHGAAVSAIEFDATLLSATGRRRTSALGDVEPPVLAAASKRDEVAALSVIALLEGHPKIDWVAGKLGMSRRSLQRALVSEGASFSMVLDGLLRDRATTLIASSERRVTDIALQLGYADAAHFTRAFRRWTGMAPSRFRAARRAAVSQLN